ncbi:thioredoxin family protein [Niabella drilacis]|uniref:Thioredoxin-related protein n=1 Tax=Niabella drilacis (strain DSM 25811 / CCM 8410 / CCUG 62505 / LMG 26954 / E90) TaxID=1285928 RepID=A0A1G6V2I4_NIADE|nr:thioredoxin family protein [Niabella drilacis]SDD47819.1 Thioredoxin-related protein [Niabella drilacis]
MKKQLLLLTIFAVTVITANAQDLKTFRAYDPAADAQEGIRSAVSRAKKENKHVLVQIGGNWCIWCARFDQFTKTDTVADSLLKRSYIVYHLNYSKENKNLPVLASYSFPQRFGFPVFLVLDKNGKLLHTQNSGYLEEGKGYSKEKVSDFLMNWTPGALDPGKYKE